jgi:glycerol-3-phosphate dehydrogenase
LQGTLTIKEVYKILSREGTLKQYPLFSSIHGVAFEGQPPEVSLRI